MPRQARKKRATQGDGSVVLIQTNNYKLLHSSTTLKNKSLNIATICRFFAKTSVHLISPANPSQKLVLGCSVNFLTKSNNPCLRPSLSLAKAGII